MIGAPVGPIGIDDDRSERLTRHVGIEEMPEAVAPLVLAGGVVGVGDAGHVDDPLVGTKGLHRDRLGRGDRAGHHDGAVTLDHGFEVARPASARAWLSPETNSTFLPRTPFPVRAEPLKVFSMPPSPSPFRCWQASS